MHIVPPAEPEAEDEEIGEPILSEQDRARVRSMEVADLVEQARQYDYLAEHQRQRGKLLRGNASWLSDRYDKAAKANHRLAVALAEHAAQLKG